MSPSGGCPGPVTIDGLSPRLRVVALDTQWWLHAYDKGEAHCSAATEPQVLVALDAALASAGTRHVVLVAHHPLQSSGWHAGHFNWQDHFFPLTRVAKPLWIPLPGIGSLYPLFRITKPSPQDLGSREYSHLRAALGDVLRKHRPLLYAAGHEHELEVLKGDSARFFVVSGAGIYGHLTPTRRRAETLFRGTASGFMRIDLLQDGRPAPRVRCGWHRCRDAVVLDGPRLRAHIASAVTLPVGGGQLYDLTKNAIANIEHDEDDPRPAPRPSGPGAGFRYRDRRNPAGRTVESRLST